MIKQCAIRFDDNDRDEIKKWVKSLFEKKNKKFILQTGHYVFSIDAPFTLYFDGEKYWEFNLDWEIFGEREAFIFDNNPQSRFFYVEHHNDEVIAGVVYDTYIKDDKSFYLGKYDKENDNGHNDLVRPFEFCEWLKNNDDSFNECNMVDFLDMILGLYDEIVKENKEHDDEEKLILDIDYEILSE